MGGPDLLSPVPRERDLHEARGEGRVGPEPRDGRGLLDRDHIFKVLALGSPFFKAVCMGRAS
jgi:hypothetical protein